MAYKTIFEQIQEKSGSIVQAKGWYRSQIYETSSIKEQLNPLSIINEERFDDADSNINRDQNRVTFFPKLFSLMYYEYRAKTRKDLPFYDKFPLSYILSVRGGSFFAVNLHYYSPEERVGMASRLAKNKIPRFRKGAHKYLLSEVKSPYLHLAQQEWNTICLLPVEEFVRDLGGVEIPIPSDKVWSR